MPKRKVTNPDDTPPDAWSLSEQQQSAVLLIVSGKTLQATADTLGVQRPTVSQWVNHHPGFQAALNQRRQELWGALIDELRGLVPKAVQVLAQALEGEDRVAAAVHVLKCVGLYGTVPAPSGPTTPAAAALVQQVRDYEAEHAAENTAIVLERRDHDRMLSRLALTNPLAALGRVP